MVKARTVEEIRRQEEEDRAIALRLINRGLTPRALETAARESSEAVKELRRKTRVRVKDIAWCSARWGIAT